MPHISFTLNDAPYTLDVAAHSLLVDVLRDQLGLTGTHLGCDTSQCGACLVLLNGDAVKSCAILAAQVDGAELRSIEGLASPDGSLSPVQAAFQDAHALQCGYCTPGMIVSVTDLLAKNPDPTEAQVRDHLEGNICRCTGYQNIVKAALQAAKAANNA